MHSRAAAPPPRRQEGFTLGEVLATVAVLGVSLSLAIPSLEQASRSNRRATAINELVATLHVARSEALARNATIAVCPTADGQTCARVGWESGWIRFVDGNGNFRADNGEAVLGSSPALSGLTIQSDAFRAAFAFGPAGRVSSPGTSPSGGDFIFCGETGEDPRVLVLPPLGHPVLAGQRADGRPAACRIA